MDNSKIKATDYLTESLKLIVTIATILFGGLLAYRSSIQTPTILWSYYTALLLLAVSSIMSVANINCLINKIYRGEDQAIKSIEAKVLNILSIISLFVGIISAAFFISSQVQNKQITTSTNNTIMSDSSIQIGKEINSTIKIIKNDEGRILEVTITPKM